MNDILMESKTTSLDISKYIKMGFSELSLRTCLSTRSWKLLVC